MYGLYILEVPVMIPNGLGMVFGVMQISLYVWARKQERKLAPANGDAGFVTIDHEEGIADAAQQLPLPIGTLRDVEEQPLGIGERSGVPGVISNQ